MKTIQLFTFSALLLRTLSGAVGSDGGVVVTRTDTNGSIYFGTVSPGMTGLFAPFDYLAIGSGHDPTGLTSLINTPNLDPRIYSGLSAILAGPSTVNSNFNPFFPTSCPATFGPGGCPNVRSEVNGIGFSTGASAPFNQMTPNALALLQAAQAAGLLGNVNLAMAPVSSRQQARGNLVFNDLTAILLPVGDQVFQGIFNSNTNHDAVFELNITVGTPGAPAGVPEPATCLLAGTGLLSAGWIRRARARRFPPV